MTDFEYLQHTLRLAAEGASLVSPNPMVGSIIVSDGEIVGRGYHRFDELKHAEVWALEEAGPRARGATVYVNLEPCCHRGPTKRTPPCIDALISAGVARVVASMVDPNPAVNGRGFAELRRAGIEVSLGGLETEARRLNERYIAYVTLGRPFVHLKLACSMDGRIATRTGDARWVSNEESRLSTQQMRHEYDAILTGIATVLRDNPLLTDRTGLCRHRPLIRVILDSGLRIPLECDLVRSAGEAPVIVFALAGGEENAETGEAWKEKARKAVALAERGVEVIFVRGRNGRVDVQEVLDDLGRRKVISLIVEGGSQVAASFLAQQLLDKVSIYYAPKIIGGRDAIPAIAGVGIERMAEAIALRDIELSHHGSDWQATGYPVWSSERDRSNGPDDAERNCKAKGQLRTGGKADAG